MAAAAAAAWYEELREVEYLEESIHKKMASISRRLMMAKDLSEAEAAKLKEEHAFLRKHVVQLGLEVSSPKPDFSCMTEAERAAAAERLRNDELHYARRLSQEGDPRGPGMEACARIVDFDPKQGGLYYSRYSRGNLSNLDLDEECKSLARGPSSLPFNSILSHVPPPTRCSSILHLQSIYDRLINSATSIYYNICVTMC
jgi:hypothetical protein